MVAPVLGDAQHALRRVRHADVPVGVGGEEGVGVHSLRILPRLLLLEHLGDLRVEPPAALRIPREDRRALAEGLRLAERLGGERPHQLGNRLRGALLARRAAVLLLVVRPRLGLLRGLELVRLRELDEHRRPRRRALGDADDVLRRAHAPHHHRLVLPRRHAVLRRDLGDHVEHRLLVGGRQRLVRERELEEVARELDLARAHGERGDRALHLRFLLHLLLRRAAEHGEVDAAARRAGAQVVHHLLHLAQLRPPFGVGARPPAGRRLALGHPGGSSALDDVRARAPCCGARRVRPRPTHPRERDGRRTSPCASSARRVDES